MSISKFAGVMVLLALACGVKTAAATDIKIATLVPNQSQWMKDMRAAGKVIHEKTDGRVKLKFYGGGTQGTSAKVLQKMKIGQLHGGTFSPNELIKQYPDINLYGLPFVFESWEEMRYVREQMDEGLEAGFDKRKLVTFGFVGSFTAILSNRPVKNQADLRGKKVWLPEGDVISYEAMKALQLSPVSLPLTDVLTGLQTGLLDIATTPPEIAVALQWHTRVKYFTEMPVIYAMNFLAIDKRIFNKLSDEDQGVVREVLNEAYTKLDAIAEKESKNATEALVNIGIKRVEPDAGQLSNLIEVMSENNRKMAQRGLFSVDLFEEMQQHIKDYRNRDVQAAADSPNGS